MIELNIGLNISPAEWEIKGFYHPHQCLKCTEHVLMGISRMQGRQGCLLHPFFMQNGD